MIFEITLSLEISSEFDGVASIGKGRSVKDLAVPNPYKCE
jgi:hypothetical protein